MLQGTQAPRCHIRHGSAAKTTCLAGTSARTRLSFVWSHFVFWCNVARKRHWIRFLLSIHHLTLLSLPVLNVLSRPIDLYIPSISCDHPCTTYDQQHSIQRLASYHETQHTTSTRQSSRQHRYPITLRLRAKLGRVILSPP